MNTYSIFQAPPTSFRICSTAEERSQECPSFMYTAVSESFSGNPASDNMPLPSSDCSDTKRNLFLLSRFFINRTSPLHRLQMPSNNTVPFISVKRRKGIFVLNEGAGKPMVYLFNLLTRFPAFSLPGFIFRDLS